MRAAAAAAAATAATHGDLLKEAHLLQQQLQQVSVHLGERWFAALDTASHLAFDLKQPAAAVRLLLPLHEDTLKGPKVLLLLLLLLLMCLEVLLLLLHPCLFFLVVAAAAGVAFALLFVGAAGAFVADLQHLLLHAFCCCMRFAAAVSGGCSFLAAARGCITAGVYGLAVFHRAW